jgi:uncharacterized FAD-dependent dehydrogenase
MIRITGLSLPFDHTEDDLIFAVLRRLGIKKDDLEALHIGKRSLDARKRDSIQRVYTVYAEVSDEIDILKKYKNDNRVSKAPELSYSALSSRPNKPLKKPVIIGTGPAGLFAGLILAEAGLEPILIERGDQVRRRVEAVNSFWQKGILEPGSNVQFGEGGAGTFSDGKLQTRVKDKRNRDRKILEELVEAGAPGEILIEHKPHIGTANLVRVVENLRKKIISFGGELRFRTWMEDLILENGRVVGIVLDDGSSVDCDQLILAIGHSARDTYEMLQRRGVALEAKPFSIGFRIEHPQTLIDQNQFGRLAGHQELGPASYQLAHHTRSGRTVYSFCMCPGGKVIAASSETGGVVTNGMSQFSRSERNANSAIVAEVSPADYGASPLGGIEFQRIWERKAFQLGGENYFAPCQKLEDFQAGVPSNQLGEVIPSYRPGIELTDLGLCLPDFVTIAIKEALGIFEGKIKGFTRPDAVLTGVETRTSAPLRILRGKDFQSLSARGLYPVGEGSGYAGGILSSAMDGMKAAEAIIESSSGH